MVNQENTFNCNKASTNYGTHYVMIVKLHIYKLFVFCEISVNDDQFILKRVSYDEKCFGETEHDIGFCFVILF